MYFERVVRLFATADPAHAMGLIPALLAPYVSLGLVRGCQPPVAHAPSKARAASTFIAIGGPQAHRNTFACRVETLSTQLRETLSCYMHGH